MTDLAYGAPGHPPAGWHPDPHGSGLRWWDGAAWTEHVSPTPQQPLPISSAADPRVPSGRQLLVGAATLVAVVAAAALLIGRGGGSSSPQGSEAGAAAASMPPATAAVPSPAEPPAGTPAPAEAAPAPAGAPAALAKERAHTAQIAIETYATDHGGSYASATPAALIAIEPTLQGTFLEVAATTDSYRIVVQSEGVVAFSVEKEPGGGVEYGCFPEGQEDCPTGGDWG